MSVLTKVARPVLFAFGILPFLAFAPANATTQQIECGTADVSSQKFCALPEHVTRVALAVEKSHAPCVFGDSWGLTDNKVWTAKGCIAQFRVQVSADPLPVAPAPATPVEKEPFGYVDGNFRREA